MRHSRCVMVVPDESTLIGVLTALAHGIGFERVENSVEAGVEQ